MRQRGEAVMRGGVSILRRCSVGLATVVLALGIAAPPHARADDAPRPKIIDVEVGFAGLYKLGRWTSVSVIVDAAAGPAEYVVQLIAPDGDGVACRYPPAEILKRPDGKFVATSLVRFGRPPPNLSVAIVPRADVDADTTDRTEQVAIPQPLAPGEKLFVSVGPAKTLAELARGAVAGAEGVRIRLAALEDFAALHHHGLEAYDGVDGVYLAADDVDRYPSFEGGAPAPPVLVTYLILGGRVFVAAGADARGLLSRSLLGAIAGLMLDEPIPLPRATALEEYVGGNKPLRAAAAELRQILVPRLRAGEKRDAVVELAEGDLPLIVRRAVGFGTATWLLVDLEQPVLREWIGRGPLLARVLAPALQIAGDPTVRASTSAPSQNNYGFVDLAGQLHQALDRYAGVSVVPFYVLALMTLGYISLIGPLDYLLVHKMLRRPALTWLTFPLLVAVGVGAAYAAAGRLKGRELRTHQVDILDCDLANGLVRGTHRSGVFSPASAEYDVRIAPPTQLFEGSFRSARSVTSWSALSGDGLGGMHRGGLEAGATGTPYRVEDGLQTIAGVPIEVWSSKLFAGTWFGGVDVSTAAKLQAGGEGRLAGQVRNPCRAALENAMVCYGSKAYRLGTLAAGETRDLAGAETRELQALLSGARIVEREKRAMSPGVRTLPHDLASLDVEEILTKIMFYDAAGGASHARLGNDDLAHLDFSELLRLKRAVLIGRVAAGAAGAEIELKTDGRSVAPAEQQRLTIVRLVIPVEQQPTTDD